jgi:UbiD family decarboxylase
VPKPTASPADLRVFLAILRERGDLVEVDTPVDAELEVPEIHRRVIAAGGPALLFRNVKGSSMPLAVNLFGTRERVLAAFGDGPLEKIREIAKLPEELMPPTPGKLWAKRGLLGSLAKVGLKRRSRAPVTEIIEMPPRLSMLPATKSWPRDGGRFVTLPLVLTEHPEGKGTNLGMYRVQLFDDQHHGLHMQIGKGGGYHLAAAEALGRPLPVNVHVGGPPAMILSAIAPLPENLPELLLASLVLGKRLDMVDNPVGPLPIVGNSEVVLVGEVAPGARRAEGPFGDHYGYYSETHDYPLVHCKAVLRRKDAIWPATVVGKPRQEDFFLGDYLQELLAPLLPLAMPGVIDLWSYGETGYHSLAAAVVHERYRREAMVQAFRILGEGQLSLTKFLLLTDSQVDLRDFRATLEHVLARADFRTDLYLFSNLSMDSLDYSGPAINEGGKGVLLGLGDAIRELPREYTGPTGQLGGAVRDVQVFCAGCLVVEAPAFAEDPELAARIANDESFADWPMVVLADDARRATKSAQNFLWTTFTRFDPGQDIVAKTTKLLGNHPTFEAPIVIDARMKPDYPEELFCDGDTAATVDRRWKEYFPAGGVEMGDSDRGHLD